MKKERKSIELKELVPLIKYILDKKKVSIRGLAKVMNKSPQYISNILLDEDEKNIEAKLRILKALGVNATKEIKQAINIY